MRIELTPLKLEKEKGITAYRGNPRAILYVLDIAMLVDDELYVASKAASTALEPHQDKGITCLPSQGA